MKKCYLFILILSSVISANGQTQSIDVSPGWNLLSLPLATTDSLKSVLFPSAVSSALIFQNVYEVNDTLQNGPGFWLKFDSDETINLTGTIIYDDTITVRAGWNLVGSLTLPFHADSIRTVPEGIIVSEFFNYPSGSGYQKADIISPGFGYWVKVNQDGLILLSYTAIPCPGISTVSYSGKIYNTVQIGSQCWLRENLDVGAIIQGTDTSEDNGTIERYCYDDNPYNCYIYGGLYKWDEAMQYDTLPGGKGICPSGFHIPTRAEFYTLNTTVGGDANALKEIGQGTGTNTSGFSALMAGLRTTWSGFDGIFWKTCYWSSDIYRSERFPNYAEYFSLYYNTNGTRFYTSSWNSGFSIRCLKDEIPAVPHRLSPATGSVNVTILPTMKWRSQKNATSYTLQVSTDSLFSSHVYNQSGLTDTSQQINELDNSTKYYWRVSATNMYGTSDWSSPGWAFTTSAMTPCPNMPIVDYAGKIYNTVQIGTQCWLKENLDVGTRLYGSGDQTDNNIIEKYCYDDDTNNCNIYGGLYQWNEAMQYLTTEGTQGICPDGWHLPTNTEYQTLSMAVGDDGNALKEIRQGSYLGAGTNTSGFSALLAGYLSIGYYRFFISLSEEAIYLSSTEKNTDTARCINLSGLYPGIVFRDEIKIGGFSVRCIKDLGEAPQVPEQSSPPNGAKSIPLPPTLIWNITQSAASYRLQVSTDSLFSSCVYNQGGLTSTSKRIDELDNSTKYYWRVNATNIYGTSSWSSPVWDFTTSAIMNIPCPGSPTVFYSGKTYSTVQIGSQCWLKENLDVGSRIDGSQEQTNNSAIEKYCYYDDPNNCNTYGGLYRWDEAMQYSTTPGVKGICPNNWHVPTLAEFQALYTTVGGNANSLKREDQGYGAGQGTNITGFSALLSGDHYADSEFYDLGTFTFFWSSTEYYSGSAYFVNLGYDDGDIYVYYTTKDLGFSIRCVQDFGEPPEVPTLSTPPIGSTVVSTPPTLIWHRSIRAESYTLQVSPDSLFSSYLFNQGGLTDTIQLISGLNNSTKYYWRVRATNSYGISGWSSPVWNFTTVAIMNIPCPGTPTVFYSGKTYNTVQIGSQCWLKENLNVGTMIDSLQNQTDNETIEKYCYRNDTANCNIYGGLYQWNEAMHYSRTPGVIGICPEGFHLPTYAEFQTLSTTVGGDGNALKEIGQGTGAGAGTNTSGFSALLSGFRSLDGGFYHLGRNANLWSSIEYDSNLAYGMHLGSDDGDNDLYNYGKVSGISVRCIKD